jgi:bacterioferritin
MTEAKTRTSGHYDGSLKRGVLAEENREKRETLLDMLKTAYWMEIETVMSYIANSVNPDGVRAQEVIEALSDDIQEELGHAQRYASRIKEIWGVVPGSEQFEATQTFLQPPANQTDIVHVIRGVIEAEKAGITLYNEIIELCDGWDPVTQDMVTEILRDEERHLRLFEGFLREFEPQSEVPAAMAVSA